MDDVTKAELQRLHDEEQRQNKRLDLLEKNAETQHSLALSVQELAINMRQMLEVQKEQGTRLEKLETQPAETLSDMKKTAVNTIVGVLAGALATGLLLLIAQNIM